MTTSAKAKPEVGELLTKDAAQERGLVPRGHVWNERDQRAEPLGEALVHEQLARPIDLEANLAAFKRNRDVLMAFVKTYLQEAEYDSRGYPISGKLHDYYKVPGTETKALTKLGGEKLAQLFRMGRAATKVVASLETKEYASATVECILTDQYRREIGSAVSSCSTAESSFQRAAKKYGGDWRAALNDVVARAAKRAFVSAVIVATSADEIFVAAPDDSAAGAPAEQAPGAMPEAANTGDLTLTRDTPCPFARDKALKDLAPNQVRWLQEPGRITGPDAEEWQALVASELASRAKGKKS